MPRDYKSRVQQNSRRSSRNSLPGYIWMLSGLCIGLFVALIIYLDKQPEKEMDFAEAVQIELEKLKQEKLKQEKVGQEKLKNSKQQETTAKNSDRNDSDKEEKKEQKFNFYTLLPELEILIPESETRPPEPKPENKDKPETKTIKEFKSNKQYVLQVGSFQNINDAEKLKANLAFLGLSANIQHVTVNSQAWHRVRTGPYKNKKQLYDHQQKLAINDIHSIPMELK